jgi:hypothetical protein
MTDGCLTPGTRTTIHPKTRTGPDKARASGRVCLTHGISAAGTPRARNLPIGSAPAPAGRPRQQQMLVRWQAGRECSVASRAPRAL